MQNTACQQLPVEIADTSAIKTKQTSQTSGCTSDPTIHQGFCDKNKINKDKNKINKNEEGISPCHKDKEAKEAKVNSSLQGNECQQQYMKEYNFAMFHHVDRLLGSIQQQNSQLQTNNVLLRTFLGLLCALLIVLIYFALYGIQIREIPQDDYRPPKYNDYAFSYSVSSIDTNALMTNHTQNILWYVSKLASEWYSTKFTTNNTTKSPKIDDTNWRYTYDYSKLFSLSLRNITFHHETVLSTLSHPLEIFLKRMKNTSHISKVNATA